MTKNDTDTILIAMGFAAGTVCAIVYAMFGPNVGGLAFVFTAGCLASAIVREHVRLDFTWLTAEELARPTLPDGEEAPVEGCPACGSTSPVSHAHI